MAVRRTRLRLYLPRRIKHTLPWWWVCYQVWMCWWTLDGTRLPRGIGWNATFLFICKITALEPSFDSSTFVMLQWTTMCSLVKSSPVHREKWLSLTLQMEILLITLVLIGLCVSTLWDIAANSRIVRLYVSPILIRDILSWCFSLWLQWWFYPCSPWINPKHIPRIQPRHNHQHAWRS